MRNVELKAWQLGAKAHELFMLASLSFIAFYHMRRLLIGSNGIPFGLLIATFTAGSPTMLKTRSFWAGFARNRSFGLLLVLVCILSVILGPSSAIAMIPSLDWFELNRAEWRDNVGWPNEGEAIYFLEEPQNLWPTALSASTALENTEDTTQSCESQPFDFEWLIGCPASGFATIANWVKTPSG